MKKLIVLSNMGGARNEKELKLFLKNMFKDKRISPGLWRYIIPAFLPQLRYKKVWKNYEKIGGSRIYKLTESLVYKMNKISKTPVTFSMRYTQPFLKDVVQNEDIYIVAMYPHFSTTTVQSIIDEMDELPNNQQKYIVHTYYNDPDFNKILSKSIISQIDNPQEYHLIFSAHGLPVFITRKGDPYRKQIEEHVEILSKLLPNFKSISLGFQSRLGPIEWEKPYLEEVLKNFKGEKVIIYPLSFLIDNSETDFELKIEYATYAKKIGIRKYKVLECLNDNEELAHYLLNLVRT